MDMIEKKADEYFMKQLIDYGDQNLQAEDQIKEAFCSGYEAAENELMVLMAGYRKNYEQYKMLVQFYDKHVGTPCEEIRHKEEVEDIKARLPKWISVRDAFPDFCENKEKTEKVLLLTYDGQKDTGHFYKQRTNEVFASWSTTMPAVGVTHWCYLLPSP